jgi:hypothetical protein
MAGGQLLGLGALAGTGGTEEEETLFHRRNAER